MSDGNVTMEADTADHLTTMETLAGDTIVRCNTCGNEGPTAELLKHKDGCPEDEDAE